VADDITGRIIKEGNRIARIVGGLLSFSRRRHEEKSIVSVKDILSDCLTLTTTQMRQDSIIFKIRLPDNLPQIMAQVLEIEQVFINIISNARYALNQKYPQPHDAKLLEITSRLAKKNHREYVRVSFLDHGTGIPANIIDKVRNPFFSTKTEGKRTGLGLSISHGIVESHEGKLTIDSIEGQFTRINVDLPVWRGKAHSRNVA
jgi:signal transduction histidine kinase